MWESQIGSSSENSRVQVSRVQIRTVHKSNVQLLLKVQRMLRKNVSPEAYLVQEITGILVMDRRRLVTVHVVDEENARLGLSHA